MLWLGSLDLILQMNKESHTLILLLGHCKYELGLPKSTWWLLQTPPPFSVTVNSQWFCFTDSPIILLLWDQSRGSHKATHNAEEGLVLSPGSFSLEKPETQGKPLSVVLCWPGEGTMWSMCSHFSYFFNVVCLGLCGAGECFSLTQWSKIPSFFLNGC